MRLRWNAGRLLCICSILLQTFATPIALACSPVDEDGNPIDPSAVIMGPDNAWVCFYFNTGACLYDVNNGELDDPASASTACPRVAILQPTSGSSANSSAPVSSAGGSSGATTSSPLASTSNSSFASSLPTSINLSSGSSSAPVSSAGGSSGATTGSPLASTSNSSFASSLPTSINSSGGIISSPPATSVGDSTSRSSPSTSGGTASGQIGDVDRMHRLTISPSTVELEVATSLVSIGFLVAVVVLAFWARRRRHRIYQRRLADQFIDTQENTPQGELRAKHRDVVIPHNARPTEAPRVGLENDVLPHNELEEGPDEEPISLRMRQIEANLAALLTLGLPRSSPPSYTGSRRNSL